MQKKFRMKKKYYKQSMWRHQVATLFSTCQKVTLSLEERFKLTKNFAQQLFSLSIWWIFF